MSVITINMDIFEIEGRHKNNVSSQKSKIIDGKKKMLITFPFPYMNGRPHLGHGYTVLNADLQARYYKDKEYNVMFPFGFHGSGMPIVACAEKLKRELEKQTDGFSKDSQYEILKSMGINPEDIYNFTDPKYWIKYFSKMTKDDLVDFNIYADFRRSFYTTDMNFYFDSFVRWQFKHLLNDGYVYKGTREMIFSPKDNQPCASHDRHTGEDVDPVKLDTKLVRNIYDKKTISNVIITIIDDDGIEPNIIYYNNTDEYVSYFIEDDIFPSFSNKESYNNISFQFKTSKCNSSVDFSKFYYSFTALPIKIKKCNSGFFVKVGTNFDEMKIERKDFSFFVEHKDFSFWMPEKEVISRSGDKCVVAKSPQWFINYGDVDIKKKVMVYASDKLGIPDEAIRHQLIKSVEWINEWACSRNFGLGTFIPNTEDLIDSLSDSTIYMAFYTVVDVLKELPSEVCTIENMAKFFDGAFLNESIDISIIDGINDENVDIVKDVLFRMEREFKYWYPVDIRVSGKDLLPNHLNMSLFNHLMIWKDERVMPRNYFINGHLLLNNQKMSKHTGNFKTLSEIVKKYGTNVTRFILASNDGVEDGNFDESKAGPTFKKLQKEYVRVLAWSNYKDTISEDNIWHNIFQYEIIKNMKLADLAYKNAKYKSVLSAFYNLEDSADKYKTYSIKCKFDMKKELLDKYNIAILTILNPICPTLVYELCEVCDIIPSWNIFDEYDETFINDRKWEYYGGLAMGIVDECFSIIERFKKKKKVISKMIIETYKSFSDDELMIINNLDNFNDVIVDKSNPTRYGKCKKFHSDCVKKIEKYGSDWKKWVLSEPDFEMDILKEYVQKIIGIECGIIQKDISEQEFKYFQGEPYCYPIFLE